MPKKSDEKYSSGKKGGQSAQQTTVNPLAGAAMGAAIGGAMGAAAAVVLSDKERREKLKEAATNLKDQAIDRMQTMKSKAGKVAEVTKEETKKQLSGEEDKKKAA